MRRQCYAHAIGLYTRPEIKADRMLHFVLMRRVFCRGVAGSRLPDRPTPEETSWDENFPPFLRGRNGLHQLALATDNHERIKGREIPVLTF